MNFKRLSSFALLFAATALAVAPAVAQDEPTIVIYNNSGTLQFDAGGTDPAVLGPIQDYIAESSGVRPQVIVPAGNAQQSVEALNLLLGSSDPIDTFQAPSWYDYRQVIIPLNDLLEEHGQAILEMIPEEEWAVCTDAEGNIMCIPRLTLTSPYITWVRQDWLDELGLEVPTTVEELEAVFTAFRESKPDAVMATRYVDIAAASVGGFTEFGRSSWLDESDGQVKPWILQPGVRDWVAKISEWFANDWWFADSFATYDEPELFRTCNIGVWMGWYSRITLITPQIESACEGIEWTRAPITGPAGEFATVNPQGSGGYVVTAKSQNPAAVIQFYNWVWEDITNQIVARYGLPEEGWNWVDEANAVVEVNRDYGYVSEYTMPHLRGEIRYQVQDPARAWHTEYLGTELLNFSDAKMPMEATFAFDGSRINEAVPGLGDLNRLIDEQLTLFITGQRSLDDWDSFIADLDRAGMQDWIGALTEQYNEKMAS
jgi:ABC-type glycerol-3-phosphate transport system substrate-binding protein